MTGDIKVVLIEYDAKQERVIVRGVFESKYKRLKPLSPGNQQNYVQCFEDADMGYNIGFKGLVAKE